MKADGTDDISVQSAVFCEAVILSQTGSLSLVNIIEGLTLVGEAPPSSLELVKVVISLWAVPDQRPHALWLQPWGPDGERGEDLDLDLQQFGSPKGQAGLNLIRPMPAFDIAEPGSYWFDVVAGREGESGHMLTHIPLTVLRQEAAA